MEEPRKSKSELKKERKEKIKQAKSGNKTNNSNRQAFTQNQKVKKGSIFSFLFLILTLFLVVVFILWLNVPKGKILFAKDLTINELSDTSGYPTPDFEIKKRGVYDIEMECKLPIPPYSSTYSSELTIDVEVFDSSDVKLNEFAIDLYNAAGYSDGESWRENVSVASQPYLIENPGKYSAEIFATKNPTLSSLPQDTTVMVYVEGIPQYVKKEKAGIPFIFRVREGSSVIESNLGWIFLIFGVLWCIILFIFFMKE
jgi:hypothetical protein